MTYTVVIPSSWETDRQDTNDILTAYMSAFMTAVPGVIRKSWSEIPASATGEVPFVYLGEITESISMSGGPWNGGPGLRHHQFSGVIGYVDVAPDNQEANTRANTFADYMRELFAAKTRINPPGLMRQTGLREGTFEQGPLRGFMHLLLDWVYDVERGGYV